MQARSSNTVAPVADNGGEGEFMPPRALYTSEQAGADSGPALLFHESSTASSALSSSGLPSNGIASRFIVEAASQGWNSYVSAVCGRPPSASMSPARAADELQQMNPIPRLGEHKQHQLDDVGGVDEVDSNCKTREEVGLEYNADRGKTLAVLQGDSEDDAASSHNSSMDDVRAAAEGLVQGGLSVRTVGNTGVRSNGGGWPVHGDLGRGEHGEGSHTRDRSQLNNSNASTAFPVYQTVPNAKDSHFAAPMQRDPTVDVALFQSEEAEQLCVIADLIGPADVGALRGIYGVNVHLVAALQSRMAAAAAARHKLYIHAFKSTSSSTFTSSTSSSATSPVSFKEDTWPSLDWWHALCPQLDKDGIDLLRKLLALSPNERISAEDALKHDFFKDVPLDDDYSGT